MNKIKVKIKAYEAPLVESAATKIIEAAKAEKTKFSGPVPLPTKREIFTILRSVHVNKKSREQFERKTHKRLIVLEKPTEKLLDGLKRLELPSGVDVSLEMK